MNIPCHDIFIDLETLGLRPGAAVYQVGACAFNLDTGTIGETFFREIKPAAPFTASIETLQWREEKGLGPIPTHGLPPREAIFHFLDWLRDHFGAPNKELRFWSWGSTMDFTVLEPLLDLRNPEDPHPWEYWQVMDARGFWKLAFGDQRHADRPHHALEDAIAGAKDLVAAVRELRYGKIQALLGALDGAEQALEFYNIDPTGEDGNPTAVANGEIARIREVRLQVTGREAA